MVPLKDADDGTLRKKYVSLLIKIQFMVLTALIMQRSKLTFSSKIS